MVTVLEKKPLLGVLAGVREPIPPIWLMRQAGRYLPEYRAIRAKAESFLDLCFDPARAAEVTLQPIRRFGFDAAILFSDILVVPHALGQRVSFEEGGGPKLDALKDPSALKGLRRDIDHARLEPVYETIARVKQDLPAAVALLGFCGAPWTLATYMIAGHGTVDQHPARLFAYRFPDEFARTHRYSGRGLGELSDPAVSRPVLMRFRFSIPGREICRRANSGDGVSSRARALLLRCARKFPAQRSSVFRVAPAPGSDRILRPLQSMRSVWIGPWSLLCARSHSDAATDSGQSRSAGAIGRRRSA